jgi:hypothetical protein
MEKTLFHSEYSKTATSMTFYVHVGAMSMKSPFLILLIHEILNVQGHTKNSH